MSKAVYKYSVFFAVYLLLLCGAAAAQSVEKPAKATVEVSAEGKVRVSGEFGSLQATSKKLSFELSAAGFDGLGSRIKDLKITDTGGRETQYKTFVPGEYAADAEIASWNYAIDISPRKERTAAAHISWAKKDIAVLMLGDLLPHIDSAIYVDLKLPENWRFVGGGRIEDASKAVIVAGKDIRTQNITTKKGGKIAITTVGEWRFTDAEAAEFAQRIFDQYTDLFGVHPTEKIYINILPFPERTGFGEWQAETRGNNVTIISSDMPFSTQSVQRLHEQLRHEMFHLWIPNLIKLSGNYDWFYEGFALYGSLKLGLAVNRISFADYLDTLSRAATIDSFQTNRTSLINASKNRTIGGDTNIYARGMLVAFLCDAALLERSKGERSVEDILRELFKSGIDTKQKDANAIILEIMAKEPELVPIIKKYIEGAEVIDMKPAMAAIGLENNGEGKRVSLGVIKKPSGRQKEILNKLGYNNWRKLSPKTK